MSIADGITARQFRESEGVADWRVLADGAYAFFATESFAAGSRLVGAIERRQEERWASTGPTTR